MLFKKKSNVLKLKPNMWAEIHVASDWWMDIMCTSSSALASVSPFHLASTWTQAICCIMCQLCSFYLILVRKTGDWGHCQDPSLTMCWSIHIGWAISMSQVYYFRYLHIPGRMIIGLMALFTNWTDQRLGAYQAQYTHLTNMEMSRQTKSPFKTYTQCIQRYL